jgi:hypothetical protein
VIQIIPKEKIITLFFNLGIFLKNRMAHPANTIQMPGGIKSSAMMLRIAHA